MRKLLLSIGLVLASLLVVLVALEIGVRILSPHEKDHVIPGRLFKIDENLGWRLKSNWKSRHETRYFDVIYETNSHGWRDEPRDTRKSDNVHRVLQFGDSQVFGWGVSIDDRFSNLLEKKADDLEVWNMAVPGYGLDQEILAYEYGGGSIEADEVVLFVSEQTLLRTTRDYIYDKSKPVFRHGQDEGLFVKPPIDTFETRIVYELLNPFFLPYFVQRRLRIIKSKWRSAGESRSPAGFGNTSEENESWNLVERMILRAHDTAKKHNHRFSLLSTLEDDKETVLQQFCIENEIRLLAVDINVDDDGTVFGEHDSHWTPKTHGMVADAILSDWKKTEIDVMESYGD